MSFSDTRRTIAILTLSLLLVPLAAGARDAAAHTPSGGTASGGEVDGARRAAVTALPVLRDILRLGLIAGFETDEEIPADEVELVLRRELPVYVVWAQDLRGWKPKDGPEGLLSRPEKFVFTVGDAGDDCFEVPGTVTVEKLDGEWRVTELLRASLLPLFLDKAWACDPETVMLARRGGAEPEYIVDVPDLYQFFLAYEDGLDPIFEHQRFHLGPPACPADTDCRLEAKEVFRTLKKLAKSFPGALKDG